MPFKTVISDICDYSISAEYTPQGGGYVVFGGGSGNCNAAKIWKLSPAGTITALNNAPNGLGSWDALFTREPATGKFIMFTDQDTWYEYKLATDTWTQITSSMPPLNRSDGAPFHLASGATPVDTYGVILYVNYIVGGSKTYIYKHAPTSPECGDGFDNDLDGKFDANDEDCYSTADPSEDPCSDGSDYCEQQCVLDGVVRC